MKRNFIVLCLVVVFIAFGRMLTTDMPTYSPQTVEHKHDITHMWSIIGLAATSAVIVLALPSKKKEKTNTNN